MQNKYFLGENSTLIKEFSSKICEWRLRKIYQSRQYPPEYFWSSRVNLANKTESFPWKDFQKELHEAKIPRHNICVRSNCHVPTVYQLQLIIDANQLNSTGTPRLSQNAKWKYLSCNWLPFKLETSIKFRYLWKVFHFILCWSVV